MVVVLKGDQAASLERLCYRYLIVIYNLRVKECKGGSQNGGRYPTFRLDIYIVYTGSFVTWV